MELVELHVYGSGIMHCNKLSVVIRIHYCVVLVLPFMFYI